MARDHASTLALGALLALPATLAFWPTGAATQTCDAPFMTDLVTGTGIHVGHVKVCNDADKLTVTYETTYPWCVTKTNLDVAKDLAGIPKTVLGTPNWLNFDIVEDVDCKGDVPYDIPLADIGGGVEAGDTVTIAARAVVDGGDANKKACLLGDTCVAWGAGTRFRPRLPATYFSYTVQEPLVCGGTTSWCVFVTSGTFTGDLVSEASNLLGAPPVDGLEGADAICQSLADSAGTLAAPGTYKAWLSASGVGNSAAERLVHSDIPYKLVDGSTVANDWQDLTSGSLRSSIHITEVGGDVSSTNVVPVWSATTASGAVTNGGTAGCSDWTNNAQGALGALGDASSSSSTWTETLLAHSCAVPTHLYCFQQPSVHL